MIFWGIVSAVFVFEGGPKGLGWRGVRERRVVGIG